MKLSPKTIRILSEMVCGSHGTGKSYEWPQFQYRTAGQIHDFLRDCKIDPISGVGGSRLDWTIMNLEAINDLPSEERLPSPQLQAAIRELVDPVDLRRAGLLLEPALEALNELLGREGLKITNANGNIYLAPLDEEIVVSPILARMTPQQRALRKKLETFLDNASEDLFLEELLRPMLRQLGFRTVKATGHKDKSLEYGKDMWFKYELPTGHFLYFGLQAKKGRIHAARTPNQNVAEILAQVRMLLDHPIFDAETNQRYLVDHAIISATGEITKQAQNFIGHQLSQDLRRHILFMDREHIIDVCLSRNLTPPEPEASKV